MQYAKKMQILPLSYDEDFGDCGFAAVGLRRKNEINAAFNALSAVNGTVPSTLSSHTF